MRYGGEDYYAFYIWDVRKIGEVGYILSNITRIDKFTHKRERLGSMFIQRKAHVAGRVANYGGGFHAKITHMFNSPR